MKQKMAQKRKWEAVAMILDRKKQKQTAQLMSE